MWISGMLESLEYSVRTKVAVGPAGTSCGPGVGVTMATVVLLSGSPSTPDGMGRVGKGYKEKYDSGNAVAVGNGIGG